MSAGNIEKTLKKSVKSVVKKSRFNMITLNQDFISQCKIGLFDIWPDTFYEIDCYWEVIPAVIEADVKNSEFYKRLNQIRKPRRNVVENIETFIKDVRERTDSRKTQEPPSGIIKFFDKDKERRCKRFMNGQACSSNCSNLHIFPETDGIYCKFYYLHRTCSSNCIYYHGKMCSAKTKKAYEDKDFLSRCPKIMNRENCTDSRCKKSHRLPKDCNVYCFAQLSLECEFGSECLYKHRDDLNYPESDNMTLCNDSMQSNSTIKSNEIRNLEFCIGSQQSEKISETTEISEENSDEDSRTSDINYVDDTESIGSGPEYYFSSSHSEDDERKVSLYSGLGSILSKIKKPNMSPVNSSGEESSKKYNLRTEEKENRSLTRSTTSLCPYEDSEGNTTDSDVILISNVEEFPNRDASRKAVSETLNLEAIKKERDLFDLDVNEFIVHDLSEIPDNEETPFKSPSKKGNNIPIECVKIKTEVPIYDISSDDEVSNSTNTTNQDPIYNFKNEVKIEDNTSIKCEPLDNSYPNTFSFKRKFGSEDVGDLLSLQHVKREDKVDSLDADVEKVFENLDSEEEENESLKIFEIMKRIKLDPICSTVTQ